LVTIDCYATITLYASLAMSHNSDIFVLIYLLGFVEKLKFPGKITKGWIFKV